ncbi:Endonuclease/exonuclease/phosphatase family domain-containing protein 1 [Blattella germanica]|nr:Endonuclease/exonuclease/phosphatase family domain-containing protein 1 [Blattella germanica]
MKMGQNSSVSAGARRGRRKSFRDSWRTPFPRRSHTHQGTLSAAFNFNDIDMKVDQLNINTASEEELMTLPGITRSIAQNVVEYRKAIGRYKKVEDLALVSGIGAEKLDLIRPEICVSRRKNVSCASSRAQSMDSLPSTESSNFGRLHQKGSPHTQGRPVNINTATVFELMSVHGLNQELAANIVEYRDKKGAFHAVEDLIKVKGINQWRLGSLHPQLVVQNGAPDLSCSQNSVHVANGKVPGTRKISASLKTSTSNGFLPGKDIFELLSAYSQRPILEEDFHGVRNGKVAVRVATWNLQNFTLEKIENPGVKEIICRTILENSFSLIAVQEVVDDVSLKQVCDELNCPTLRRVADWKDNEREWKCALLESQVAEKGFIELGFLYDSSSEIELLSMKELSMLGGSSDEPKVEAVLAVFKVGDLQISFLNIHVQKGDVQSIEKMVQGHVRQTDVLIIVGDFTGLLQKGEDEIPKLQYKNVIPTFHSVSGVVRQGLNHLAIPRGWMWGGAASEHCPVWCEVYTEPLLAEKALPNGVHHPE